MFVFSRYIIEFTDDHGQPDSIIINKSTNPGYMSRPLRVRVDDNITDRHVFRINFSDAIFGKYQI